METILEPVELKQTALENSIGAINGQFGHDFAISNERVIVCRSCGNKLESYPLQSLLFFRFKEDHPAYKNSVRFVGYPYPVVPVCEK